MQYAISYDLVAPGRDYQRLYNELSRLGGERILLSQWVVNLADTSARSLLTHLRQYVDTNDRLMVTCLDSSDWAGVNLLADVSKI